MREKGDMMRNKKYPYGKAHHEKYPFKAKVTKLFSDHIEKMQKTDPSCLSDYRVNNLLINLRNNMFTLVDEIYKELKIRLKHNITINSSLRPALRKPKIDILKDKRCEICNENRAVNFCHIISCEEGGRNSEDNYVFLCPTHHFLFDQARLRQEEFEKISLDGKPEDVIKYFNEVHIKRHQMFWRYGTNKSRGCNCGSQDFSYDTDRNGNVVQICLRCNKCREKRVNLWLETHPISENSVTAFDILEEIPNEEKEKRYLVAEQKLRKGMILELNNRLENMNPGDIIHDSFPPKRDPDKIGKARCPRN